jgi:solute carrier family 25 (mitochondrial S-adenosylmethionine transporter), member 26
MKDKKYQNTKNFISGGFALSTAFAVMHPLDTIKTQLQTNTLNFKQLGRGFYSSFLLAFPQGGLRLMTYEYTKKQLLEYTGMNIGVASAFGACVGDTVSSIVKVPREVITCRLQSGMGRNAVSTAKSIVNEQGMLGLFRGFWSTTFRDWPFMIILFSSYESMKEHHHYFTYNPATRQIEDIEDEGISSLKSTIFGGISGGLAGFLTTPFDVIKTNIMTSDTIGMKEAAKKVYRQGATKFFTGGMTRSVWW